MVCDVGDDGGQKPRIRKRQTRTQVKPKEQPAPWLDYVNHILDDPLPLHPTDSEGYAALRWLLYHAMDMHLEQNHEWEMWYLQAITFIAQHYAGEAYNRFKLHTCIAPAN